MRATLLPGSPARDSLAAVTNRAQIVHYGHACVLLDTGTARLLFDPGCFSDFDDLRDLDAILITHQHADHADPERFPALVKNNPGAALYADPETAEQLGVTAVRPGDAFEVGGTAINIVGGEHATIHRDYPVPANVGYVVDHGAFYHPGDSLFVPEQKIDVLGIPFAAPWVKTGELLDFQRAVAPRVSVAIHDSMLSDLGRQNVKAWLTEDDGKGPEVRLLTRLAPAEL
jgi:L-ascorbate metabolism protein UlaG (beta-lactamase superfamily)